MPQGIATELISITDIDETTGTAKERLEQALIMIENLNETFIREAKAINPQGFEGEFYEAFNESIDEEEELTKQLNEDNSKRILELTRRMDKDLVEASTQKYTYELELIPIK